MAQYRKALKNYTTSAPLPNMINKIQGILLDFGALGIGFGYEPDGSGKLSSIIFSIDVGSGQLGVKVPFQWRKVKQVLDEQGYYKNDDQAYRVAVANVKDWLDAQMAFYATNMVEFPQIFLPYINTPSGKTYYEIASENGFQLEDKSQVGAEKIT